MSPFRRLWNVVRRGQLDRELQEEVATHLALIEDEARANGESDAAARQQARVRFGSQVAHREQALDSVISTWVESAWKELGFAARRLVRSPAFTIAAVLTLALAIAANAAIFAVVERVLLNPLPYPDSDRLIVVDHGALRLNIPQDMGITRGYYYHYLERAHTLDGLALFQDDDATLTGDREPERIRVGIATPSLASVLRVRPAIGRWFAEDEGRLGAPRRAVLSHGLWARRFGSDPRIIGRTITLSGVSYEVIGVMSASFAFPDGRIDVWEPLQIARTMGFGIWLYNGVARLRDGVRLADARSELNRLIPDVTKSFPGDPFAEGNSAANLGLISTARTAKEAVVGDVASGLWIVLASVSLVLLVACANVANLFLVRSEVRQREVSVRLALGAGRAGIARYFLAESAWLSAAGGLLGLVLAWGAVQLLVSNGPATLPRLNEIRLDRVSIAYTAFMTAVTAVLFGAVPLFRREAFAALNDGSRGNTASRTRHRARRLLMAGQVALALVLLIASGLMVRSFQKMRNVDPGFNPASALMFNVALPAAAYTSRDAAVTAQKAILERVSALPGVVAATASTGLPFTFGGMGNTVLVPNRPRIEGRALPAARWQAVSGGFFETMGIRLLRGRTLTREDVDHRQPVVVVNDALATRLFPGEDPIGRYLQSAAPPARPGGPPAPSPLQIVGIVANTATRTLTERTPGLQIYMPMSIAGGPGIPISALVGPDVSMMNFVLRSTIDRAALLSSVRRAIDAVDPRLAIAQAGTLQALVDRASGQMAFTMVLIAVAASVALLLGVVGIYGVMSYIVSQRNGEIGVRLALGAEPKAVASMILRQGSAVTGIGALVGLLVSIAGSRLIASLLYGVGPRDPVVFAATTMLLLLVATIACWLPARSAARLSPLEALRT
jgi:putative ABC transport system permease protein